MPTLHFQDRAVEVNDDGFLAHPDEWDDDLARFIALDQEGQAELTRQHWAVIRYIRGFYEEHGLAPLIRNICRTTGIKLKTIYTLFPSGPARGACKVAGLPSPDGCI